MGGCLVRAGRAPPGAVSAPRLLARCRGAPPRCSWRGCTRPGLRRVCLLPRTSSLGPGLRRLRAAQSSLRRPRGSRLLRCACGRMGGWADGRARDRQGRRVGRRGDGGMGMWGAGDAGSDCGGVRRGRDALRHPPLVATPPPSSRPSAELIAAVLQRAVSCGEAPPTPPHPIPGGGQAGGGGSGAACRDAAHRRQVGGTSKSACARVCVCARARVASPGGVQHGWRAYCAALRNCRGSVRQARAVGDARSHSRSGCRRHRGRRGWTG